MRRATLRDVRDLCRIYEVDPETSAELMELAKDAYQSGWWARYDDLKITPLIGMEQSATAITSFGMYFFGPAQSAEYSPRHHQGHRPEDLEEKILERAGSGLRMERRRQLFERGPGRRSTGWCSTRRSCAAISAV